MKIVIPVIPVFLCFVFMIFVVLVESSAKTITKENRSIVDGCQKTDLYIIGNKGVRTQVYDCSGVQLD